MRVDVIYSRFSERKRAIVDTVAFLILFLPVIGFMTYEAGDWMLRSWNILEKSTFTYWYPPIYPLRTAIFAGLLLFLLQGIAQFWRDAYLAVKGEHYD